MYFTKKNTQSLFCASENNDPKSREDPSTKPFVPDVRWLEAKVQESFKGGAMSAPEMTAVLVKILASKRTSEELQMELFELLGFDRIDLIQLLLVSDKTTSLNKLYLCYSSRFLPKLRGRLA